MTDNPRDGNGAFVQTVESAQRDADCAALRSRGYTYRQIAAEMGMDLHRAHDAVKRAMKAIVQEPAEEALQFELQRLDEELVRLDKLHKQVEKLLEGEHVTVSQGRVVTTEAGDTVPDDEFVLKCVDRLAKIDEQRRRNGESRRRLLGLDQPAKTQLSGGLTYEVVGIDPQVLK